LVFVNERDDILVESSQKVTQRIFYGNDNSSIRSEILKSPLLEIRLWINDHSADIKTFLFGDFWKDTLMAAAQIGYQFGLNLDQIKDAMESYKPEALRSQIAKWNQSDLILDCYNANPSSMEVFVKAVQQSPETPKILILGEMLELGEYSEEEHQYLIDQVIKIEKFEKVILVGNEFFKIKLPKDSRLLHFEKNSSAKDVLTQQYKNNSSFIYVKGSRGNKLEEIFDIKH
jgi:UDP-N-acetylmuramoyl-tripeptide--D-alanyl-D-alanine ligase